MPPFIFSLWNQLRGDPSGAVKMSCFHCGDAMKKRNAVSVQFDGASRAVCCHGCAAILTTVEQMGMQQQYREQKVQASSQHEE